MRGGDPGDCLVCGAAHCSCGGGPIEVVQLPWRDAAAALARQTPTPLVAETVQETLGPGEFTTATYRGTKKRGSSSRP
jgi:hypothetical protein